MGYDVHITRRENWRALFDQAVARIAGPFGWVEPRAAARAYLLGLLSGTSGRTAGG